MNRGVEVRLVERETGKLKSTLDSTTDDHGGLSRVVDQRSLPEANALLAYTLSLAIKWPCSLEKNRVASHCPLEFVPALLQGYEPN